ncbi:MAG: ferric reductase-like transmembrane domain-containing protein [Patescibacteria group bacterium]|nr:ferric reductase-like transmembrane domain-containing protein [Patescibacteria group bacterium]
MRILRIPKEVIVDGNLFVPKRYIDNLFYYVLPVTLGVLLFYPGAVRSLQPPLGIAAEIMLLIVLFVKPFAVFFPKIRIFSRLVGLRRQLGLATFFLALAHFLYFVSLHGLLPHLSFWSALTRPSGLRSGTLALLLLAIISASSIWFIVKRLKKWWKRVQRLSYLVLPLVLLHATIMRGDSYWFMGLVLGAYIVLKGIEWYLYLRRKRRNSVARPNDR